MTPVLPDSTLLVWWANAWLAGRVAADDLLDAMATTAAAHSVHVPEDESLPHQEEVEGGSLLPLLAWWRRAGASGLSAVHPADGHPVGLAGPKELNRDATEAGEAVLVRRPGVGLVPHRVGAGVTWTLHVARPAPPLDLGEADRTVRSTLLTALDRLEQLDVAGWSPDVADAALDLARLPDVPPVPGVPTRVRLVAARALQARAIVDLALADHGAAVSAHEVGARREALVDLDRAARVALSAAGSPDAWPPDAPQAG